MSPTEIFWSLWFLSWASLLWGVAYVKLLDQGWYDRNRQPYVLTFPGQLDTEQVIRWVYSVAGTLRRPWWHIMGVKTLAFETVADSRSIRHRLLIPWQHADYVTEQLRSHIPGINAVHDDDPAYRDWSCGVEFGMTSLHRRFRITKPEAVAATVLASLQALRDDEAVVLQWVITPAGHEYPPAEPTTNIRVTGRRAPWLARAILVGLQPDRDEIKERRAKLEEPNFLAVGRIAASAATPVRAEHLRHKVEAALASTHSHGVAFRRRLIPKRLLIRRIRRAASALIFPAKLTATEVATFSGFPLGQPHVAGLPQGRSRQLAATETIPREGRVIAVSNFPGAERPLALSPQHARQHVHAIGPTDSGKTTLLSNMFAQDVAQGSGVVLIESKGDLFYLALDAIPAERKHQVVVLDVTDTAYPVALNILAQGKPRVVVEQLGALFHHLYRETRSVYTTEMLFHGLSTLVTKPELTFCDLVPLLVPMTEAEAAWRDDLIRSLTDHELRNFWQRFDNYSRPEQDRVTRPVMDRIWQLNARPEIRNIIGQSKSSFDLAEVVAGQKILLVNLAGLGKETASLTGTLIMNALWQAVKAGAGRAERPTFLYLDEFQDFVNLPVDPADMLAQARSLGLGMVLAHQHLGQLPMELRQAVLANARSKIVFQTTADDARTFTREFGRQVEEHDFMNLGKYEVICRLATGDGVSAPVTGTTRPPVPRTGLAKEVRALSRKRYGRPVAQVEAEIGRRRSSGESPRRPKLGGMEWQ